MANFTVQINITKMCQVPIQAKTYKEAVRLAEHMGYSQVEKKSVREDGTIVEVIGVERPDGTGFNVQSEPMFY